VVCISAPLQVFPVFFFFFSSPSPTPCEIDPSCSPGFSIFFFRPLLRSHPPFDGVGLHGLCSLSVRSGAGRYTSFPPPPTLFSWFVTETIIFKQFSFFCSCLPTKCSCEFCLVPEAFSTWQAGWNLTPHPFPVLRG